MKIWSCFPSLVLLLLALMGGCASHERGLTYSLRVDRVENEEVVLIVHLHLEGGLSWYEEDAKDRAGRVAERVVRLELAKMGITDYTASAPGYLQFSQHLHRSGMGVREGSGRLARLVGQTFHGTLGAEAVASLMPSK